MLLGLQPSEARGMGLSSRHGAPKSQFESLTKHVRVTESLAAAGTTEAHGSPLQLRFNSLSLDELSQELDRRTKETQRLQEEVENAAKVALERFGCAYDIHGSPGQTCHDHGFNVCDPPGDFMICPTNHQAETQPQEGRLHILNRDVDQSQIGSPGKDALDNAIDDRCQQRPDTQAHYQPKRETFHFDKAIVKLQSKLQEVQMAKDVLSDLRLNDSRIHVDQMEKMLCMVEELQNIKRATDQKLQETEDETFALNRKVMTLEEIIKETYSSLLSQNKQYGNGSISGPNITTNTEQPSLAANITEDLYDKDNLQDRPFLSIEHLEREECSGLNQQKERMNELIATLGQEMALLSDKLSSSKYSSVSLSAKLELLRKLSKKQTSLHQCHVSELESTLSSHKDKVCCLEQQLSQVRSQLVDVQRERERSSQQTEELQSQLGKVKSSAEQRQRELQVEIKALRGRLEEAGEQMCRTGEEKHCLQALLDQRTQEGREAQELLLQKDEELQLRQQEVQQTLHVEGETLRLKLEDRDKLIGSLRLQMESSAQLTVRHGRTVDNLYHDNSLLGNQLNQHKLEIQQLRAELEQHRADLATRERERQRLQGSVAEQSRRVQEETLEKQQLAVQLEIQRLRLITITKEHDELQRLHSCKDDENKGAVLRLQSVLRNAYDELDQARSTLRTLEGADGHGLEVAIGMQQEVTARREQVDSLQGKIQHLEETVERLSQEKRDHSLEHQRKLQELNFVREEKIQLASELEALRSKDQQLRNRIDKLEAIFQKTSERFADCQDFIQLQEQDFYRLKLRHALDLKQLQGQHLHTALTVHPSDLGSLNPLAPCAPPVSRHASNTRMKASPSRETVSLVKELRGVISGNHRPHGDSGGFRRRRSAPERVHRTACITDEAEEVKAGSRLRRKTFHSGPHVPGKDELTGKMISRDTIRESRVNSRTATAFQQLLSLGRRSPVHSLLTSDPNS